MSLAGVAENSYSATVITVVWCTHETWGHRVRSDCGACQIKYGGFFISVDALG